MSTEHTHNCDVSPILFSQSSSSCYSLWTDMNKEWAKGKEIHRFWLKTFCLDSNHNSVFPLFFFFVFPLIATREQVPFELKLNGTQFCVSTINNVCDLPIKFPFQAEIDRIWVLPNIGPMPIAIKGSTEKPPWSPVQYPHIQNNSHHEDVRMWVNIQKDWKEKTQGGYVEITDSTCTSKACVNIEYHRTKQIEPGNVIKMTP